MNDFTKEELQFLLMTINPFLWLWDEDPLKLENKIQFMIDNYCDNHMKVNDKCCLPPAAHIIGDGNLMFHNKDSCSAIIAHISSQINLCENLDESYIFRINWKILYGKQV